jgi:hypothetical protein
MIEWIIESGRGGSEEIFPPCRQQRDLARELKTDRASGCEARAVVGGAFGYSMMNRAVPRRDVTTAPARGDFVTTITASGSVDPVLVVQVGTDVPGTIEKARARWRR